MLTTQCKELISDRSSQKPLLQDLVWLVGLLGLMAYQPLLVI